MDHIIQLLYYFIQYRGSPTIMVSTSTNSTVLCVKRFQSSDLFVFSTLPQRSCFLAAAATPNKHMVAMYIVCNYAICCSAISYCTIWCKQ